MDRDPFAEQVLALMRFAPKGCATTEQSIDWTPALAVRGTALRRIAAEQKGKVRVLRKSITH
jgi:hypothetical protein